MPGMIRETPRLGLGRTPLTASTVRRSTVYLASPYTHRSLFVRRRRFEAVTGYAADLWAGGHVVYSPITQTHEAAQHRELPQDWAFWKDQCLTFLTVCTKMVVLALPGWRESVGVQAELRMARAFGIPVSLRKPPRLVRCAACPENLLDVAPMPCDGGGCPYND